MRKVLEQEVARLLEIAGAPITVQAREETAEALSTTLMVPSIGILVGALQRKMAAAAALVQGMTTSNFNAASFATLRSNFKLVSIACFF